MAKRRGNPLEYGFDDPVEYGFDEDLFDDWDDLIDELYSVDLDALEYGIDLGELYDIDIDGLFEEYDDTISELSEGDFGFDVRPGRRTHLAPEEHQRNRCRLNSVYVR